MIVGASFSLSSKWWAPVFIAAAASLALVVSSPSTSWPVLGLKTVDAFPLSPMTTKQDHPSRIQSSMPRICHRQPGDTLSAVRGGSASSSSSLSTTPSRDNSSDTSPSCLSASSSPPPSSTTTEERLQILPLWLKSSNLRRELLAELIGTYLIVMIGSGSVMSAVFTESLVGLFQIASCWIIAVTVAIYCTSKISGAHLNPAISIALATFRDFEWRKVGPYSLAQLAGAVLGSATSYILYASTIQAFESANGIVRHSVKTGIISAKVFGEYFASPVTTWMAFVAEAVGTAVLAFVIFALTNPKNDAVDEKQIPLVIGLTVGSLIACIAPLTQAGFNPARDFGPRIVAWLAGWKVVAFKKAWVYIAAPIVGALGGAFMADRVLYADTSTGVE